MHSFNDEFQLIWIIDDVQDLSLVEILCYILNKGWFLFIFYSKLHLN